MINRIRKFLTSGKIQDGRLFSMPSEEELHRLEELRKTLEQTELDLRDPTHNVRNDNVGLELNLYNLVTPAPLELTVGDLASVLPVAGDALDAGLILLNAAKGNYGLAAIGAGMLVVPNIVEKPLKWAYRVANKNKKFGGRLLNNIKRLFGWKPSKGELYSNLIGSNWNSNGVKLVKNRLADGGFNRLQLVNNVYYSPQYRKYLMQFEPLYGKAAALGGSPSLGGLASKHKFAKVFTDYPNSDGSYYQLTDGGAHEFAHFLGYPNQSYNALDNIYDFSKTGYEDYFRNEGATDLAARGTQLKNFFGLAENEPLTGDHLRYALKYYSKDTGINNTMTEFFRGIKDYDKFALWLNWAAPLVVGGVAVTSNSNTLSNQYRRGGVMKRRFKGGGKSDPVLEAYANSLYDWEAVRLNLKALGYDKNISADTLAYVEQLLKEGGIPYGDLFNIILADAGVETEGRPTTASRTSSDPTYWGLWQFSKSILPEKNRTGGIQGALDLTSMQVKRVKDKKKWLNGSYPDPNDVTQAKIENRKPKYINVGYNKHSDTYNVFWDLMDPIYTHMYGLRLIPRNAKVKAFTDGLQRPADREDYAVKLAKFTKALEQSLKKK